MVLGCLRGKPAKDLQGYLRKARHSPLFPLYWGLAYATDKLFSELNTHIPNPPGTSG